MRPWKHPTLSSASWLRVCLWKCSWNIILLPSLPLIMVYHLSSCPLLSISLCVCWIYGLGSAGPWFCPGMEKNQDISRCLDLNQVWLQRTLLYSYWWAMCGWVSTHMGSNLRQVQHLSNTVTALHRGSGAMLPWKEDRGKLEEQKYSPFLGSFGSCLANIAICWASTS